MDGPDVAETSAASPFQSEPDAAQVRLIVRRVKAASTFPRSSLRHYSYHGFLSGTGRLVLEADHRRHAEIENGSRP